MCDLDIKSINARLSDRGLAYQLAQDDSGLYQLVSETVTFKPLMIDFTAGKARHRQMFGGGVNQPLAKAAGIKKQYRPTVLDLTAGMGRDAYVLATLGCQITMTERIGAIAVLLQQAIDIARNDPDTQQIAGMMQLQAVSGQQFLIENHEDFDTIYMDPMYPHRDKTALVKKEMRIFRELAGDDCDAADMLVLARARAIKRVVVKRPKGGELLGGFKPDFEITSPNTRYDVYLNV